MQKKTVSKNNKDFVTRVIENETILMPIYKTSDEINCIYTLNESAAKVWEMIDGKKSLEEIKAKILEEFDVTPKEVDEEMGSLLKDLKEIKAIA